MNVATAWLLFYKLYEFSAMSSRICCLAVFQRGTSIFGPTTSTTFEAVIEPILPQISRGIPNAWPYRKPAA